MCHREVLDVRSIESVVVMWDWRRETQEEEWVFPEPLFPALFI